jgi:hypothetical protein
LDAPEGGLDAMMQAMECWDEIGNVIVFWNTDSMQASLSVYKLNAGQRA